MNKKEYVQVKNKYLAEGLAFLGYRYMKFDDGKTYSFKNEHNIEEIIECLLKLKKQINLNN